MEKKIVEILKQNESSQKTNFGVNTGVSHVNYYKVADELVKLFAIPDVIKSICTHHITDCQHVKLYKECTFKDRCNHKQTVL